mgnify:CR=1 FL=1
MEATILYGNGLNRLSKNPLDWNKLLHKLAQEGNTVLNTENKPYTMAYEELFLSGQMDEETIKNKVVEYSKTIESNRFYEKLYALELKNYLTTNYDYAFEKIFEENNFKYELNKNRERIYSVRTYVDVENHTKIWHIHGDINRNHSISLGLDQYCGSIGKMNDYIKGKGDYKEVVKIEDKIQDISKYDSISWIELFFNTDIHIIGQGMDFSETDLWWILDKRARFLKRNNTSFYNKIYYYEECMPETDSKSCTTCKKQLLNAFGVKYVQVKHDGKHWEKFWDDLFKILENNIVKRKKSA